MTVANDNPNEISDFISGMKRQVIEFDNMAEKILGTIPKEELRSKVYFSAGKCSAAIQGIANAMRDYIKCTEELERAYKDVLTK